MRRRGVTRGERLIHLGKPAIEDGAHVHFVVVVVDGEPSDECGHCHPDLSEQERLEIEEFGLLASATARAESLTETVERAKRKEAEDAIARRAWRLLDDGSRRVIESRAWSHRFWTEAALAFLGQHPYPGEAATDEVAKS